MNESFVPQITIRLGANPFWRGYASNWDVVKSRKGFLVHPTSPSDAEESVEFLQRLPTAFQLKHSPPLDARFYDALSIIEGVTLFNVSRKEVSAECHQPFPGWEVIEPKIIEAIKLTLPAEHQIHLTVIG